MRASHKKRLARLVVPLDFAESEAVDRRSTLRLFAELSAYVRAAMLRAGIDPNSAASLCRLEAKCADFADTPELQAADAAFEAAHPSPCQDEEDPRGWLQAEVNRIIERQFADGSLPDFARASFSELWAWAILQAWLRQKAAPRTDPG
jgi:hypothetical protein